MNETLTLTMNVKYDHTITVFALVKGGWYQAPFLRSAYVLVDRNIVSTLKTIDSEHDRGDGEANKWWFSFLNSPEFILNPLLCSIEGNDRKVPTLDEFVTEIKNSTQVIKEKLTKSSVVAFEERNYKQLYEMFMGYRKNYSGEKNFLIEICPLITNRISNINSIKIEKVVFSIAQNNNIPAYSLLMLAVLSCIYDDQSGTKPSIGRKVLKPSKKYNDENAHNALSDLLCLNVLNSMCIVAGDNVSFVTRDKPLAAFWCAIRAKEHRHVNEGEMSFTIELTQELFPRLSLTDIEALKARLHGIGL